MDSRKFVIIETAIIFAGELICSAAMVGIFALLDSFDRTVLLGAVVGALAATLNFLFMAIVASLAADKAQQQQNVKGGQAMIQSSYFLRMIVLFVVFFAFAKSGLCNVIAMVVPLVFVRPILTIVEFFRKSGETNT